MYFTGSVFKTGLFEKRLIVEKWTRIQNFIWFLGIPNNGLTYAQKSNRKTYLWNIDKEIWMKGPNLLGVDVCDCMTAFGNLGIVISENSPAPVELRMLDMTKNEWIILKNAKHRPRYITECQAYFTKDYKK